MNHVDEELKQKQYHQGVLRTAESSTVTDFIEEGCDWAIFAGNGVTVKVQPDRYSKTKEAYITQARHTGEDIKPDTRVHKNIDDALEYTKRYVRTGGKTDG